MTVLGIDEAGRGPVIGPLVVAGVEIRKEDEKLLKDLGIKDSKLLTAKRREELEKHIKKIAKNVRVIAIQAQDIDRDMKSISLNQIEMNAMADIINSAKNKDTVIIDLPSTSSAFAAQLKSKTGSINLIAEHKADEKYPAVSAASVIAKVERDRLVKAIEKEHGAMLGSGYPADPVTKKFLENHIRSHDTFPPFVRKSWQTAKDLTDKKTQKGLQDF